MVEARAPRNRTVTVSARERDALSATFTRLTGKPTVAALCGAVIHSKIEAALPLLPAEFVDLLIIDPPYNLTKSYAGKVFARSSQEEYQRWFVSWLEPLRRTLKNTASIYICCDWRTSAVIYPLLAERFTVRNRITWEREKGRGASQNWKNSCEDIWYCTVGDDFYFDVEAVKMQRRVIAPYRSVDGTPKDWMETERGRFRLTHPSNLWTDISVPFWSMPENTDHPTQKPEKLIAKLILASSRPGDFVFDPFLGSGTTAVTARKLGRTFAGVEAEEEYCLLAAKRLHNAKLGDRIQGYGDGVFWERNAGVS